MDERLLLDLPALKPPARRRWVRSARRWDPSKTARRLERGRSFARRAVRALATFTIAFLAALPTALPLAAEPLVVRRIGLLSLEASPRQSRELDALVRRAEVILPQLENNLGARFGSRFRMALIPAGGIDHPDFAAIDSGAPPWAAGYVVPRRRLGAIRIAKASQYPYGTLESVLAHECAHVMLHDAGARLPLWFEEGLATWEGRRWSLEDAFLYTTSLLTDDVPSLAELDPAFHAGESEAQMAYTASFAFVARTARRSGPDALRAIVHDSRSLPFATAWQRATGRSLASAEAEWRRDSLIRYRWIPILTASSTLWVGVTFLAVVAGIRKRKRARDQRKQWDEQEPEEQFVDPPGEGAMAVEQDHSENRPSERSAGDAPDVEELTPESAPRVNDAAYDPERREP